MSRTDVIRPGSMIGVLGDGQLAKMIAVAAGQLGYKVFVLGPKGRESPAGQVAYHASAWGDSAFVSDEQLEQFCSLVRVVLVEWENVPVELVKRIEARGIPVRSSSRVLAVAQDRVEEKTHARSLGIRVPAFRVINEGVVRRMRKTITDRQCILKTTREGYDGKGQIRLSPGNSIVDAWEKLGRKACILEDHVRFVCEISIIVARSAGDMRCIGPFENKHENGILRTSTYPMRTIAKKNLGRVRKAACEIAESLAHSLGVHGLLAVELFVTPDGKVIFNEMAARPHNSGHLTIECCDTSQFEQYVRAACNLPLGSNHFHSFGEMINIIGDEVYSWERFLDGSRTGLHLYGKDAPAPGRKMGHAVCSWHDPDRSCF